jgi:hypothetical protein
MCVFFFSTRARFVIGLWAVKFARKTYKLELNIIIIIIIIIIIFFLTYLLDSSVTYLHRYKSITSSYLRKQLIHLRRKYIKSCECYSYRWPK